MPTVIFKACDYYKVMMEELKLIIVDKSFRTWPQIENIRSKFAEKISVKGNVKSRVCDFRTAFLDFVDGDDFNSVWWKKLFEIK